MTIEIRQLVIRAVAEARPEDVGQRPAGAVAAAPAPQSARREVVIAQRPEERRALIAACVREVLRELQKSQER